MNFSREHRMLVGLSLLALAVGLAGAAEPVARDLQAAAAAVNLEAREPEGKQHVITALAALFDIGPETIERERAATGLGFGEIAIAHAIAEATGSARTFQQIVAMKQSGLGWGQVVHALSNERLIAEEHLGPIVSQVRRAAAVAGALRESAAGSGGLSASLAFGEGRGAGHGRGGGRGGR